MIGITIAASIAKPIQRAVGFEISVWAETVLSLNRFGRAFTFVHRTLACLDWWENKNMRELLCVKNVRVVVGL